MDEIGQYVELLQSLKRKSWRMQYKNNKIKKKEIVLEKDDYYGITPTFEDDLISELFIQRVFNTIQDSKARYILKKIIIEGYTEKEVANELGISQQAVNKWKRKTLDYLKVNRKYLSS